MTVKAWTGWCLLAAICASLLACKIVVVSGPSEVSVGDRVTYVLEISSVSAFGVGTPLVVLAEVPAGWQLDASTYEGTVGGLPVAGNAVVVQSEECELMLEDLRPGFRRWHVMSPGLPAGLTRADTGEVTLEFLVGGQPAGEFQLLFVLGGMGECGVPEVLTVNRQGPRLLKPITSFEYGVGGYDEQFGRAEVTPSPDGRHLYVATGVDRSVEVLARGTHDGQLTLIETETGPYVGDDALGLPIAVRASPDGQFIYVASVGYTVGATTYPGGIAILARDPTTGELTFLERVLDQASYLLVSPDGRHLYGAGSTIKVYSRDETSGALTVVGASSPSGHLAISPDGAHLYATSGATTAYLRDETSGELTLLETGASSVATMAAISPDGRHLYSVSAAEASLLVQGRDEITGLLSPIQTIDFVNGLRWFERGSVAVSPDGSLVVASSHVGMTAFRRDATSGELTFVENHFNGDSPIDDLRGSVALAFVLGGAHLYAVSANDDAVYGFETPIVFYDGFESGSTSAWSSVVP